ncbi:DinB family protein [uncultured Phycicoccus sp.]|uniref:DinB family protein n=1 Tax=uncultured Phycicoccus sp. TaxID=661422 RepID=UPI00262EE153|nr:DinB family protein [uncultured Phycicoccus sp.]
MSDIDGVDLSGRTVRRAALRDVDAREVDLSGARAQDVLASGLTVRSADLSGSILRDVLLVDVRLRGSALQRVEISGEIDGLTVNGIDVGPLVEAELDRRFPDHAAMRPTDAAGFRHAWDVLEELWAGTVARARRLEPHLLHESVDGEWSFVQTLRHLAFATESWLARAILGDPRPWHPLSLPWDEAPDTPGVPRDRQARPDLDTVLALRHDRQAMVRRYLDELTDEGLAAATVPVEGPGWPEPVSFPVRECLLTILNEEWWHRRFAERDLDALESRA